MCVNMKKKDKDPIIVSDKGSGRHHAPIYSVERNPIHNKYFLTVGDWSARLWYEDTKTPIMTTQYAPSYLTAGCWSPTRAGVFFTCRMDGVVDVWDYFYTQSEVAYSHKVGDTPLSSIAIQGDKSGGKLCAIGDDAGTVTLLELCDSLAVPQANEKSTLYSMFDRETKREQNLDKRMKDLRKRNVNKKGGDDDKDKAKRDEQMTETLRQVDADFLSMVRESEDGDGGTSNDLKEVKN
jgi:dynein intermediate chain 2